MADIYSSTLGLLPSICASPVKASNTDNSQTSQNLLC